MEKDKELKWYDLEACSYEEYANFLLEQEFKDKKQPKLSELFKKKVDSDNIKWNRDD